MRALLIDGLIGKKINKLTLIKLSEPCGRSRMVLVKCDCGNIKRTRMTRLLSGKTKSCGCLAAELFLSRSLKHGLKKHKLYSVWLNMRRRCYDKSSKDYKRYGAEGVVVCKEWKIDFKSFYDWAMANGWKHDLQLDKDKLSPYKSGKMYSPKYCCFLSPKENAKYRRGTRFFTFNGKRQSLVEWCAELGVQYRLVGNRIWSGWSFIDAISIPKMVT